MPDPRVHVQESERARRDRAYGQHVSAVVLVISAAAFVVMAWFWMGPFYAVLVSIGCGWIIGGVCAVLFERYTLAQQDHGGVAER